ncbi:septum formation initiator [Allosaccharopolyspora coralli]|uniref:Septum formation initiator n=1 Tax=Allosaccharopolyspora coralli TaxID=2665642 RepID=A0A5Q3Q1N8_9PSEU|nr:septum site-determining protein Ssd [Allosaccharopolyspora coralli]QGK68402.1 septum formation initiator [Allosaccharopolyspora coralli]
MSATPQPLLITTDVPLSEEIQRLAAVAGCGLQRVADPSEVGEYWRTAPAVVLDAAAAARCVELALPRRPGVLLLHTSDDTDFWRAAFRVGAEHTLALPDDDAELVDRLAGTVECSGPHRAEVLGVLGGCGGAGASVLAAAAALAAAQRGDRCLLLDGDPCGGGLDLAVGTEEADGLRWSGLTVSGGRIAASALAEALPGRRFGAGTLSVLAGDRDDGAPPDLGAGAVDAVVTAARRVYDTVVCDLPRTVGELTNVGLRHCDLSVVVVPAEVRACAATAQVVRSLAGNLGSSRAVVRGPARSGLTSTDVGRAVGLDVLTTIRSNPALPVALDRSGLGGTRFAGRGPLARGAREVLAELTAVSAAGELRRDGAA